MHLVRELRQRCPWDAAQTPETLRPYLVEEVLELDHALGGGDPEAIKQELGDLLLHLAFQIVLAEEAGWFGAEELTQAVERKMWARHPHLFPDRLPAPPGDDRRWKAMEGDAAASPQHSDANRVWEHTKLREQHPTASVLDGLPPTLPALLMSYRLQERAAGVGFDWPNAAGPLAKVREELAELEREMASGAPTRQLATEVGDLLFAAVNLARKLGCDPRATLEQANRRFAERFRRVEILARERGLELGRATLEELDALWEEVKKSGET